MINAIKLWLAPVYQGTGFSWSLAFEEGLMFAMFALMSGGIMDFRFFTQPWQQLLGLAPGQKNLSSV